MTKAYRIIEAKPGDAAKQLLKKIGFLTPQKVIKEYHKYEVESIEELRDIAAFEHMARDRKSTIAVEWYHEKNDLWYSPFMFLSMEENAEMSKIEEDRRNMSEQRRLKGIEDHNKSKEAAKLKRKQGIKKQEKDADKIASKITGG